MMAERGDSPDRDSVDAAGPCMLRDRSRPAGFGRAHPLGVHSHGRGRAVSGVGLDDLVRGPVATSTPLRDTVCRPRTSRTIPVTCSAPMSTPVTHAAPMSILVSCADHISTRAACTAPVTNTQVISADTLGIVMSDLARQKSDNITASIHTLH